jgi:hypothetical protein
MAIEDMALAERFESTQYWSDCVHSTLVTLIGPSADNPPAGSRPASNALQVISVALDRCLARNPHARISRLSRAQGQLNYQSETAIHGETIRAKILRTLVYSVDSRDFVTTLVILALAGYQGSTLIAKRDLLLFGTSRRSLVRNPCLLSKIAACVPLY